MRLIGLIDATEVPEAEDSADALDTLQALFAEWRGMDLMIPDYAVDSPGDELTIDLADREAVAYQLALRMDPEYGLGMSPEAQAVMAESWRRFHARYFQPGSADLSELPRAAGQLGVYSIDNG